VLVAIHPEHPEPRKIQRAVEALQAGEIIAYPTDTVYGLGCDLTNRKAVERLYAIKRMDRRQPLAFICPDLSGIARWAIVENAQYRVLRHFLPGPYCFILGASREVPKLLQTKQSTVGIRVPDNAVCQALARELGRPIISTAAADPDGEPLIDTDDIVERFKGLAMVLDGGVGKTIPTSVIDLTKGHAEIVREGAGAVDEFRR